MIPPVDFLWEQMDGPQIQAIEQALYNYMYKQFDSLLEYLNNISVGTANEQQINDIGKIMNLPRPVIKVWTENYIVFTDGLQHPSQAGFGDLNDNSYGACFSDIADMKYEWLIVPLMMYRPFLEGAVASYAEIGSIVFLDDLLSMLASSLGHTQDQFKWTFDYIEQDEPLLDRAKGDISMKIGTLIFWRGSMVGYSLMEEVTKRLYPAAPRVWPGISLQDA